MPQSLQVIPQQVLRDQQADVVTALSGRCPCDQCHFREKCSTTFSIACPDFVRWCAAATSENLNKVESNSGRTFP